MRTGKRIQYYQYGGPNEMRLEDFILPEPSSSQLIVKMSAASLNPMDLKMRYGQMKLMTGRRFPRPMGSDLSGVVDAVGKSVTRLRVGDEVFGTARMWSSGAFGEFVLTDEKLLLRKPEELSFERASAILTPAIAAWCGLVENAKLERGQTVFVHGCLGAVGRAAVQIAQSIGAKVSGSCRGDAIEIEGARRLGIDPIVNYHDLSHAALAGQFDVVFDTAGKLSWNDGQRLLKPNGMCVDTNLNFGKLLRGGFNRRYKLVAAFPSINRLEKVGELAIAGVLVPRIARVVPLSEAVLAIQDYELQSHSAGRLIICSNGNYVGAESTNLNMHAP